MTTANYATYPNQLRTESLLRSIDSIRSQVDLIRVYFNGPQNLIPESLANNPHIKLYCGTDYTDNAKFAGLHVLKSPEYYLTLDDDIIFPENYVKTLKNGIDKYKCIVAFHGRVLISDSTYYFDKKKNLIFNYLNDVPQDVNVDVGGTGVMGFHTDYFNPKEILTSPYRRMSDLVFSYEAKKARKKIICLKHPSKWLKSVPLVGIKDSFKKNNEQQQVELVKKIKAL